jgi:hypothetical protein
MCFARLKKIAHVAVLLNDNITAPDCLAPWWNMKRWRYISDHTNKKIYEHDRMNVCEIHHVQSTLNLSRIGLMAWPESNGLTLVRCSSWAECIIATTTPHSVDLDFNIDTDFNVWDLDAYLNWYVRCIPNIMCVAYLILLPPCRKECLFFILPGQIIWSFTKFTTQSINIYYKTK